MAAYLLGFVLNRIPFLSTPYYCMNCVMEISQQKSWASKTGESRKGAVAIVRFGDDLPRCLRVPSDFRRKMKVGEWLIEDGELTAPEERALQSAMSHLGLRVIPSLPVPETGRRCKSCRTHITDGPGFRLSGV